MHLLLILDRKLCVQMHVAMQSSRKMPVTAIAWRAPTGSTQDILMVPCGTEISGACHIWPAGIQGARARQWQQAWEHPVHCCCSCWIRTHSSDTLVTLLAWCTCSIQGAATQTRFALLELPKLQNQSQIRQHRSRTHRPRVCDAQAF